MGVFWPKHSLLRKRGTVILEYLDEVPINLETKEFVNYMQEKIEKASDRLMAEVGFPRE